MSRNNQNSEELEELRNHGMIADELDDDGEEIEQFDFRRSSRPSEHSRRAVSQSLREMGCQADYE